MIGHSMGSFLLRQYIQKYGSELDGAVIMGTGYQPYPLLLAGEILCSLIGRFRGGHYPVSYTHLDVYKRQALMQIDKQMYAREYEDDYDHIFCYGISFFKKRCLVKTK